MHFFPPNWLVCRAAMVSLILGTASQFALAELTIDYTLPKDGRVSLAVYDSEGRMVRTLLSAAKQTAGAQRLQWDGLNSNGQPAPVGEYSWKLLLSQGMKAEYLLSLGTSVGIDHWTAQHGGPYAVEAVRPDFVLVGGSTEGAPMIVSLNPETSRTPWVNDVWAGGGVGDFAVVNDVVYTLSGGGLIRKFDLATGRLLKGEMTPVVAGAKLEPIAPTTEAVTIPLAAREGSFRIRGKLVLPPGGGEISWVAGSNSDRISAMKGGEKNLNIPGKGALSANKVGRVNFKPGAMMGEWSAHSLEVFGMVSHISGGKGAWAGSFPAVERVAWLSPDGKVLTAVEVKSPLGLAVIDDQTLLAVSGQDIVEVKRDGTTKVLITGLDDPSRLAVDPVSGQIFVADLGKSQQVKRFSRDGKPEAVFGRAGGRKTGKYVPEDFSSVGDISADGKGGFWICEGLSAPRRTAHFDVDGKLLGEWYGGQLFYTWAAPDPEDPNIFWMDSQWGWIMQVEVDWDKRSWKVLATYPWGGNYSPELVNRGKAAQSHSVKRWDLDKDGQKETYLVADIGVQKVDEAGGRLRLVSTMGSIANNRGFEWDKVPLAKQPKPWVEAIVLRGEDPAKVFKQYRGFAWADANGDYEFQPEEFRLVQNGGTEGKGGFVLTEDFSVLKRAGWGGKDEPNWNRYPIQGFTPTGSPIWDWNKFEPFPVQVESSPQDILFDPSGNIYQILRGGGDGYAPLDTMGMGHGFGWPVTLTKAVEICKWNPKGELLWSASSLAGIKTNPGQLYHPVKFAGRVNETIGVCDKVVLPVAFWTDDGLFAGSLFDRRAEDGLPKRVYSWFKGGTDNFDPETGRALFQYDMILGGSLIKRPNGDVIFIGSGWNNCPAYKVTGWDEFERQEGKIAVTSPVKAAAQAGTGLMVDFYRNDKLEGTPAFSATTPRIWMEPLRAKKHDRPELDWPKPPADPEVAADDPLTRSEVPVDSLEELEKPKPAPTPPDKGTRSARWTGSIEPRFTEDYSFAIYRVGGNAKLWIDGQLIAETGPKGNKITSNPIPLKAGQKYDLRLEWTGKRNDELHLNWQSQSQPVEHIPASALYPKDEKSNTATLSSSGVPAAPVVPTGKFW